VRRANGEGCNVRPDECVGCDLSDDPAKRALEALRCVGQANHFASGWETGMNNIFWIIGVIVVVLAVLGFLGLR
jgi:hypothetical protein